VQEIRKTEHNLLVVFAALKADIDPDTDSLLEQFIIQPTQVYTLF